MIQTTATVRRSTPGYVVFTQNDYPGWKATVNGRSVPVLRANSTFQAIRVPSGTSTVKFSFDSETVRLGAWVSSVIALLSLAAVVVTLIRFKRPR